MNGSVVLRTLLNRGVGLLYIKEKESGSKYFDRKKRAEIMCVFSFSLMVLPTNQKVNRYDVLYTSKSIQSFPGRVQLLSLA